MNTVASLPARLISAADECAKDAPLLREAAAALATPAVEGGPFDGLPIRNVLPRIANDYEEWGNKEMAEYLRGQFRKMLATPEQPGSAAQGEAATIIQRVVDELREEAHERLQEDRGAGVLADPDTATMLQAWGNQLILAKWRLAETTPPPAPAAEQGDALAEQPEGKGAECSPGEPAPPPSTPAQHYLAAHNGCATQEWQDGFNTCAAAPAAPVVDDAEDRFEQYVASLIDKAPSTQKLGERLADWLDEDRFNSVNPQLLALARMEAALSGASAPVGVDEALFDALRDNSWDLRCFDTAGGEDVGWRVVEHHMDAPHERTVAEVYEDNPRAALTAALAGKAQEESNGK